MKTISNELSQHIAGEVTTLATCWKLTRRDATVMGFTDHDRDIAYESLTYKAATGFSPSAVANSANLQVDNLDVEGMLAAESILEADILAGLYDFAEIEIFQINTADTAQGILKMRRGWLGEVSLTRQHFVAEVRGLSQLLSQDIGEYFSPSCRAALGDSRCKVSLGSHTVTGTVTSGASRLGFTDSSRSETSAIFTGGKITFTSGANDGISIEVKEYIYRAGTGGILSFVLPLPYSLAASDSYSLVKGCDKTIGTCFLRFNNVANFRGEPHVPGVDRMLETAGTRSEW
ncbi:MAG: DUF2163 domain-containing protein [Alphaproteobacteria bacterium]|nr:DUF2163 domain-containing protein [Alphaproteobacteria bacterium]